MKKSLGIWLTMIIMAICLSACGSGITMKSASDAFIGKNYESVVSELEGYGFTDIETVELTELTSKDSVSDGSVSEVSINGETNFVEKAKFEKDAKVIVTYRSILKVSPSLSAEEMNSGEVDKIIETLTKDGFTNVTAEDVYDLDPDKNPSPVRELTVGGSGITIPTDDAYPFDAEVKIITHNPYAKYETKVLVDFIPNLIFSKYDVRFFVDSVEQAIFEHGTDWEGSINLKEGKHELLFENVDDSSVKGEAELEIQAETEVKYKISCDSEKISVDLVYMDVKTELGENEVKVTGSRSDFFGKNYKDIETEFKEMGFTNIKATPLYDIIFGVTERESTDYVTIDGKNDYKKGDVFAKDVEVVIPYHMPYEEDPEYEKAESSSESSEPESTESNANASAEAEIRALVVDQPCSTVRAHLADLGYTVAYTHENTLMDFTGEIDYNSDADLDSMGWYVAGIESIDVTNKTVSLYVNTRENAARLEEQKSLEERLEENFPAYMAVSAVEQYGKSLYGSSFELNKITGMLAETAIDENTWFIKYTADVKINGQKYKGLNCEAKVSGPEDNPTVYDFNLY